MFCTTNRLNNTAELKLETCTWFCICTARGTKHPHEAYGERHWSSNTTKRETRA